MPFADHWEWDGVTWTERRHAHEWPPAMRPWSTIRSVAAWCSSAVSPARTLSGETAPVRQTTMGKTLRPGDRAVAALAARDARFDAAAPAPSC
jgi:hypothetical protein